MSEAQVGHDVESRLTQDLQRILISCAAGRFHSVGEFDDLLDLGLDSFVMVAFAEAINGTYGTDLRASEIYDRSQISELSRYLVEKKSAVLIEYYRRASTSGWRRALTRNDSGTTEGKSADSR